MEQIDPAQAQRVWQRVQPSRQEEPALPKLLTLEAEARHIYHYLHRNTPLRDSRLLIRLRDDSCRFFGILSGLCLLEQGEVTVTAPPSLRGNAEGLLRLCWRQRLQSLALLESGKIPAEFAPAAKLLAEHMKEHSLLLLELLGRFSRQSS